MGMTTTIDGTSGVTTPSGAIYNGIASGTAVASTSGTSIDFTGIPSWVKRITVMFNGVSWSSTASNLRVQIGSGSVEITGYLAGFAQINSASASGWGSTSTAGFDLAFLSAATDVVQGSITITNQTGNAWVSSGVVYRSGGTGAVSQSAGGKTTSGALDRLRITTSNGTDTFDAGSINILYE